MLLLRLRRTSPKLSVDAKLRGLARAPLIRSERVRVVVVAVSGLSPATASGGDCGSGERDSVSGLCVAVDVPEADRGTDTDTPAVGEDGVATAGAGVTVTVCAVTGAGAGAVAVIGALDAPVAATAVVLAIAGAGAGAVEESFVAGTTGRQFATVVPSASLTGATEALAMGPDGG